MDFIDYLKDKKIKVKRDLKKCKLESVLGMPFHANNVTNEDMERLRIMEKYLLLYSKVEQREFLSELENSKEKEYRKYYDLLIRYPYKDRIVFDLACGAERFAKILDENYHVIQNITKKPTLRKNEKFGKEKF